jgi:hypothetical protein
MAAMMLTADLIAANVLAANPSCVTRSIENTSAFRKSGFGAWRGRSGRSESDARLG